MVEDAVKCTVGHVLSSQFLNLECAGQFVTGSGKTGLMTHDSRFDNTKLQNKLSNFIIKTS